MTNIELGKSIYNNLDQKTKNLYKNDFDLWYKNKFSSFMETASNEIKDGHQKWETGCLIYLNSSVTQEGIPVLVRFEKENFIEFYGIQKCEQLFNIKISAKDIPEESFVVFDNILTSRLNLKFSDFVKETDREYIEITDLLNKEGWKFAPSNHNWYPVGKAIERAGDFTKKLYEKFGKKKENKKEKENLDLSGILFFDRNYEEPKELQKYLNSNRILPEQKTYTLEDAAHILDCLGHDNYYNLNFKTSRLGINKKGNLVRLLRIDGKTEIKTITVTELIDEALENVRSEYEDAKRKLNVFNEKGNPENKLKFIEVFSNLFESSVSFNKKLYDTMKELSDEVKSINEKIGIKYALLPNTKENFKKNINILHSAFEKEDVLILSKKLLDLASSEDRNEIKKFLSESFRDEKSLRSFIEGKEKNKTKEILKNEGRER